MYFRGSNDILVILSVGIQWEDLWNSYLKKSFEIHEFESLKSWMDLPQIQILIVLSHNLDLTYEPKSTHPNWPQRIEIKIWKSKVWVGRKFLLCGKCVFDPKRKEIIGRAWYESSSETEEKFVRVVEPPWHVACVSWSS